MIFVSLSLTTILSISPNLFQLLKLTNTHNLHSNAHFQTILSCGSQGRRTCCRRSPAIQLRVIFLIPNFGVEEPHLASSLHNYLYMPCRILIKGINIVLNHLLIKNTFDLFPKMKLKDKT